MGVEDRVCLVTGASSGIGAAIAVNFAKEGYKKISLVARRKDRLEEVADQCRAAGASDVLVLAGKDLTREEDNVRAIKETVDHFSRLDALVCNAGVAATAPVEDMSTADWRLQLDLNLTSPFILSREALPHLKKVKGCIVHISSVLSEHKISVKADGRNGHFIISGHRQQVEASAYSVSKAGLNMLARTTALENAANGVRVNCVAPGLVTSEMTRGHISMLDKPEDDFRSSDFAVGFQPLGRPGEPEEIARVVAFLADPDRAAFVTGSVWDIDGGARVKND